MVRRIQLLVAAVVLLVAALSTGAQLLFFLVYLGIIVVGGSYVVTRFGLADLEAGYVLDRLHARAGDMLRATYTVRNTSRLPKLWLEVHNPTTLPVVLPGQAITIGPRGERTWSVHVPLTRRGHFRVDPLALRTGDPLGLFESNAAIGGYSTGMKQRVKIAAAIVHEPSILLLDEPFNGADPRQRLRMMDMLRDMAANGATIVFSSHILEEVERLAENVLVIVSGRLAASGDFHAIRRLMTDRPHSIMLRSSDDRRFAAALIGEPAVFGVEIVDGHVMLHTSDLEAFAQVAPRVAKNEKVTIFEMAPTDESLESVFSYLVRR